MDDRDLVHVKEYHRRLMDISKQENLLRQGKTASHGSGSFGLTRMVRHFLSLGKRIYSPQSGHLEKPVVLDQELTR